MWMAVVEVLYICILGKPNQPSSRKLKTTKMVANSPIFLPLFFIFSFVFPPTATSLSNQTDLLSLLAIKSSLQDPHESLTSWNKTTHFCSWKGIECGHKHLDRVVGINLLSQGLVGPLSPHIDLLKATGGFSEANLLGAGRFGSVYRGVLDVSHVVVAVKVLNLFVRGASKSFMAECNALRNIRHRSLLKILSVCESIDFQGNDFKALVYEFKANGSLEKWLHQICDEEGDQEQTAETRNLNMIQRLNIAIDIAQSIKYLHSGTDISIVHGDLKPSNILLDHDFVAYIGDFGLAKIISDVVPLNESTSSIGIRGTIGYVAPEYGINHAVSTQGDAYSYGIILLEMFTNKRPTDDSLAGHINLHSVVAAALPDRVMEIVDPLFRVDMKNNNKIGDCMAAVLKIGVSCSKEMPRDRMSMNDVVNELNKIKKALSI